ncbi:MAG: peptidase S41, partial [Cyanobacteria bacterium J06607_13]
LSGMPVKALVLSTKKAKSKLTIKAETVGLDRIDVYIDERPVTSSDIEGDGDCKLDVALPAGAAMLKVMGYEENQLVAARRVAL